MKNIFRIIHSLLRNGIEGKTSENRGRLVFIRNAPKSWP